MKNDKTIKLYVYVDGVNDVPFYGSDAGEYEAFILANGEQYTTSEGFVFNVRNVNEQIEIGDFRYDAKRMGGAPTITCTLMYKDCLDDFWSENVYAEFNGEKYYLKQTPTSSYNNESTMYKHDLELVSERAILDNVYFFDAVVGDPQGDDKPVSNSTKVVFFGNIHEFVKRLNSSLEYAKLLKWEDGVDEDGNKIKIPNGYYVVVDYDNNITTEEKLMSFEDQFFSNVLQEIYNTYEVPYYFEGKTIHIGYSNSNVVVPTFSYGVDDALLSITKHNANYKIVNRATATGSSDNIPFYYPNNSPKGNIKAEVNTSSSNFSVNIVDYEKYSNEVAIGDTFTFLKNNVAIKGTSTSKVSFTTNGTPKTKNYRFDMAKIVAEFEIEASFQTTQVLRFIPTNTLQCIASGEHYMNNEPHSESELFNNVFNAGVARITGTVSNQVSVNGVDKIEFEVLLYQGVNKLKLEVEYKAGYQNFLPVGKINSLYIGGDCTWTIEGSGEYSCWRFKDNCVKIEDYGLSYNGIPANGDTITQRLVKYVKTSQNLMPSIYRETDGAERFYNATNDTYEGVSFNNPYVEGRPKEHIFTVEDIKPTIKDTMVRGLRIDMFSEFAYDDDDNDETYEDEEGNVYFKHPYFYGKLRVMDFNLFDHAIEQQPMTISFTSGHCGACNFEIGVTEEYPQKNPVQVYEADTLIDGVLHKAGSLKRDKNGMVLAGVEGTQQDVTTFQERQQDTSKYAVWIALKKEEETYGILMPQNLHRPKAAVRGNDGDTFVILGINLPQSYITNAEKKLEAEIIKYLQDNNDEKFTFSIEFSRIYFEENNILDQLSENSKIAIMYNGQRYDLYVSSFSYSMSEGDVLPEIRVELDDTLKVSQNALQNAISQVKSELGRAIGSIDIVGAATPYFLRKDADDEAQGRINFKKGIKFGEGGKVEVLDNNSAKLTIEYLEVTKKASFTSLEIQEKTHVGGQMLITPAAINCGEVEEFDDYYRCYFQTKGEDGEEIFNQFAVGDQAICQTYNAWGSKYYWRLVTDIGEDYIDLSKTDCDEYSDIPSAGDKIIQMGNRNDQARQNAIVIAAYGDDSPSLIMYNGINSYSLVGKNITGIICNPETKEPQMYSYGSFFFGDRQLDKNFITFQKKEGDADKNLYVNGKMMIGAGSEGLTNLSEWGDKQKEIDDAKAKAEEAKSKAGLLEATTSNLSEQITDLENNLSGSVADINKKLDGVVENYFFEGAPTDDNVNNPARQWTTDSEKRNHIGDTYTNISSYDDDTDNAGKSWRWVYTDIEHSGYHWHPIADSDAVKALQDAAKAQSTADGKSTTFLRQPTNYSKGDLWILQSNYDHTAGKKGEILTANKSSVAYNPNHWSKEVIYTDDTSLNNFISGEFATYKNSIQNQIDKKAQTWYQSTDPAALWTTDSDKNEHIGDMWFNTNTTTVSGIEAGMSGIWSGNEWTPSKVPQDVFDKIDGKAQIFVTTPTSYNVNDMWIIGSDTPLSDMPYGTTVGDLMVSISSSKTYNKSHWIKKVKYTDDTEANNAKAVAEQASAAVELINNDLNFSTVEKRSIRSKMKDINISEKESVVTKTFVLRDVESVGAGTWSLIDSEESENYGWYVSNMHAASQYAIAKINVYVAVSGAEITVHIMSRAESTYDYAMLGDIDKELSNPTSSSSGVVAHTSGKQGRDISYTFTSLSKGSHFFYVFFRKDSSQDVSPDNGYFRVERSKFAKGSLGEYLTICEDNGIDGNDAIARANSLFSYLYGKEVWLDTDTALLEEDDFRNTLYELFQDYYAAIIKIQHEYSSAINVQSRDDIAKELGYADYNDMKEQALANGSIIMPNGYLNAGLIEAGAIVSDKIAANSIKAEKIDIENLFAQHIDANDMSLHVGCTIGDLSIGKYVDACGKEDSENSVHSLVTENVNDGIYKHGVKLSSGGFEATGSGLVNMSCLVQNTFSVNASRNPKMDDTAIVDIVANTRPAFEALGKCIFAAHYGDNNQIAMHVKQGMVSGLRPMARSAAGVEYLTNEDHTIFASTPSTSLYLPDSPLDGQEYIILVPNGGVTIYGTNNKKIYLFHDGKTRDSYTCGDLGTRTEQRLYWNKAYNKWWATYIKF